MAKIIDRLLLFLFSLAVIAAICFALAAAFNWIPLQSTNDFVLRVYTEMKTMIPFASICIALLLIGIRLLYITVSAGGGGSVPSIDQRTEFGDIRISIETVENLALKAAARTRGVKDLKARVRVNSAGLEVTVRAIVDGESPIPVASEEIQAAVKDHIETTTGIPVALVTVYVANVSHSPNTFKSRVE